MERKSPPYMVEPDRSREWLKRFQCSLRIERAVWVMRQRYRRRARDESGTCHEVGWRGYGRR
jgi:hypothetical protein